MTPPLRSAAWFDGDDEVAVEHRAALGSLGIAVSPGDPRPVIGIAQSVSDLNPCNEGLRDLAEAVKEGVHAAGGIPLVFPTISLGEDLMKPTAMLYRNLMAMDVEETLRAHPIDGVVLLGNCDKTIPAQLMAAASADLPAIQVAGGSRPVAVFRGKPVGTGTDLWRHWDEYRAGRMSPEDWAAFERCLSCGPGACNTMGTASTMALLAESLGMSLPGTSSVPTGDPRARVGAERAGRRVVAMVREGLRPSAIMTSAAFDNAVTVLAAIGGSTNAVIHLCAIAGRLGLPLPLERFQELGRRVPVLADVSPSGRYLMDAFDRAGGLPVLLAEIAAHLDLRTATVTGGPLSDYVSSAGGSPRGAIRTLDSPVHERGGIAVLRGSLAPDGAVLKTSAASPALFRHRGPAIVFRGWDDLRRRLDDPELPLSADTVLVLTGCGPKAVPGMPEWGMIPIPARLAAAGVTDMVRISDGRMSGTSFGTCVLHVAPEAAAGGPLGLVQDGDMIELDVEAGLLHLDVPEAELDERRGRAEPFRTPHLRGWPRLYQDHVTQAPEGCDLDFLQAPTPEHRRFVEPVVGRS
ncbi:dihydroxy-acid dehydratase [Sphaerisporangium album]|uniref:Dihydroxy-acid dehydratase n=1 Tax=Sphaerisporangium album TaxID=509200 RepID=A0A367FQ43_9ACTN|nr:dihydroxy-acid dehydratase [Sphaerisporangium album]RCG31827.1 dihydroxy-acid dehydratase [Sphaerisporangium album]